MRVCMCVHCYVLFQVVPTVQWNLNEVEEHCDLNLMENMTTGLVFETEVINCG